ncbi:CPBP family intramembrane metalloprotease [Gracilibacillus caseinilyticus]|uniref:CPBP family intramembrane metalloprotease n=1 Tax=Gracilibacillus caseinilyticus TaxID=2932256 RepID=A0ABY4ESG8_9BACI|nr:CPBP family intramembrane glutamic endopeptidase [Gracilibacillus caseinilyticus]UOQ46682.1 CPBP family intramembrane metalloprotease [Gracilibacillus caseinilyticus]
MVKSLVTWLLVIVIGFLFFVISQVPFQMGLVGGYKGFNLAIIGFVQVGLVIPLLYFGLRKLKLNFRNIGFTATNWRKDVWLGTCVAIAWILIQFLWIFPNTGGASRPDIDNILTMIDHQWINVLWYVPLGVLGGGITEELYNRGFFIGGLAKIFGSSKLVISIAAFGSIIFFAIGHLPSSMVEWIDIVIPSTAYTLIYIYTKRLTAAIIAHSLWNVMVVVIIMIVYG